MRTTVANIFVALLALLHVYILVLEMFLWTTQRGRRAFGTTAASSTSTCVTLLSRRLSRRIAATLGTGSATVYRAAEACPPMTVLPLRMM